MKEVKKKRVLIVDDAVVVRKTLSEAIGRDPALEVAGTASNGRFALTKFPALKPDIVLLDIEMPEMDGLETVRQLRKIDAHVSIIMFSTLTEHGASATLEALALGATDYVTKPSNRDMAETLETVSRELIPRIHALCHLPGPHAAVMPKLAMPPAVAWKPHLLAPVQVVAIGVSTGGPDALARLLPSLPELSRAGVNRTAYATDFHVAAGGAPDGEVAFAGAGMRFWGTTHAGLRGHRSGRLPHGSQPGG